MNKVCIVGSASSWCNAPFHKDVEIWIMNSTMFSKVPRFDRQFDLHIPYLNYHRHNINYEAFLRNTQNKLWIMDESEEFPQAHVINYKTLIKKYGSYFRCSIAWMIALAIEAGFKYIDLYGVACASQTEYAEHAPYIKRMIAIAEKKGIQVYICPPSNLLDKSISIRPPKCKPYGFAQ